MPERDVHDKLVSYIGDKDMARFIEAHRDDVATQSLREEGVLA